VPGYPFDLISPLERRWDLFKAPAELPLTATEIARVNKETAIKFNPALWSDRIISKFFDKTFVSDVPKEWDEGLTEMGEFRGIDLMRAVMRRAADLQARHYPESWIKRDLQKLIGGLV
jgi:hypothetical protein